MYKIALTVSTDDHIVICERMKDRNGFLTSTVIEYGIEGYTGLSTQYYFFHKKDIVAEFLLLYGGNLYTNLKKDRNVQNYLERKLQGTE